MTDEELQRAAQVILDMPAFHQLWNELEQQAINQCVNAAPTDHEARAAFAAETRAIRRFLTKLKSIAAQANGAGRKAPA
ncbi:hypothetical protein ACQZ4Z_12990 [Agrobacterium vitis]|uniref:hypothetical protein n=1 Tax=Agrobacterium vitis TaxID=373 RepID=UPI001573AB3A|nr:hypothetical protein [Agrobacterium vitis]NSZ42830.1 hypothetical protein [Agrobacterium vitis]